MRIVKEIIIHCSDTPYNKDFHAADIRNWHLERNFNDIGYHFVVDLDGNIENGRRIELAGAHCYGHNLHSIGICYIGGRDINGLTSDTRTDEQKKSLIKLIAFLRVIYGNIPVHGHNEYAKKDCPCFNAFKEYNDVN